MCTCIGRTRAAPLTAAASRPAQRVVLHLHTGGRGVGAQPAAGRGVEDPFLLHQLLAQPRYLGIQQLRL